QSLTLDVLDNQSNAVGAPRTGTITFNSGTHTAFLNIGALNPGNYIFKIKLDKYLRKQFPGFIEITSSNQQVSLPEITLIAGDVNNDNQLNIADYHGLVSCFLEKANGASCVNKDNADLNEDGVTDEFDINILIRNLAIRQGE
ncbi:MAG: dockerin type I domain-containing protein, partial [Patescibacteria group bacterium]